MKRKEFKRKIALIQNFHSEQKTLEALINKLCDGSSVVEMGCYLVDELINDMGKFLYLKNKKTFTDPDLILEESYYIDFINWWLYEDVEKKVYDKDLPGEEGTYDVSTPEKLYNYLCHK